MRCLKSWMLFDYLNNEVTEGDKKFIAEHLENCKRCQKKYLAVQKEVKIFTEKMALLEPEKIPKKVFVKPSGIAKQKTFSYQPSRSPILNWKRVLVFSVIAIALIAMFFVKNKSHPHYEQVFAQVLWIQESFRADPKLDFNENGFYITHFDKQKMQVEIIRSARNGSKISRAVIPLD